MVDAAECARAKAEAAAQLAQQEALEARKGHEETADEARAAEEARKEAEARASPTDAEGGGVEDAGGGGVHGAGNGDNTIHCEGDGGGAEVVRSGAKEDGGGMAPTRLQDAQGAQSRLADIEAAAKARDDAEAAVEKMRKMLSTAEQANEELEAAELARESAEAAVEHMREMLDKKEAERKEAEAAATVAQQEAAEAAHEAHKVRARAMRWSRLRCHLCGQLMSHSVPIILPPVSATPQP